MEQWELLNIFLWNTVNMVYGAAASGIRAMTSSSSPGVSLKQEGISYMVGAELPAVIVNIMRGGPGLGSIQPAQGDYYQATRGGGNGDYRTVTLAPANLQEAVDLMFDAFDLRILRHNFFPAALLVLNFLKLFFEAAVVCLAVSGLYQQGGDKIVVVTALAAIGSPRLRRQIAGFVFFPYQWLHHLTDQPICQNHNRIAVLIRNIKCVEHLRRMRSRNICPQKCPLRAVYLSSLNLRCPLLTWFMVLRLPVFGR